MEIPTIILLSATQKEAGIYFQSCLYVGNSHHYPALSNTEGSRYLLSGFVMSFKRYLTPFVVCNLEHNTLHNIYVNTLLIQLSVSLSFFPEPLGEIELDLFRAALPYCLKVDSAPFRQKLVTSLKKIFVRIRDSCSTAVKRKTQAQFVGECVAP